MNRRERQRPHWHRSLLEKTEWGRIYGHIKTTIELPDAILERTKVAAAHRRTSMKNLVIQGLEMVLQKEVDPASLPRRWHGYAEVTTWMAVQ